MSCEETRLTLSAYLDDCVSLPARVAIDEHLDHCPVCRDEAVELRSLTRSLKLLKRPTVPSGLAESITDLITIETAARQAPKVSIGRQIARFLEPRLMPYSVGSFASVILFFLMLSALRPHFVALREASLKFDNSVVILQHPGYDLSLPVEANFAASRAPWGEDSPSLNPDGALAAMTRAYAHHHSDYVVDADADEMIVVTDVFSNGAASLAEVVQPPRDKRMLDEFQNALRLAPFVRARYDRRPDTMRVVITLGPKVEVDSRNF